MALTRYSVSGDGKYSVAEELVGINVSLSINGSFVQINWKDGDTNCNFRIVEEELREFLNSENLKHGDRKNVYGEYWKTIK